MISHVRVTIPDLKERDMKNTERQQIEKEINEVSMLQIGLRPDGLGANVSAREKEDLARWKADLQARRRKLMTAEEIEAEEAIPF
jgi:hypothetical protein